MNPDAWRLTHCVRQVRNDLDNGPRRPFPESLEQDIRDNYFELIKDNEELFVAVRSSATAEDLPDALICRPARDLP